MPPQRRRVLHEIKLDKIAAVDAPCQEHAVSTIMKRSYTEDERQALADKGNALPDGSFPIADKADLGNAVKAYGRASDKAKAKAHIIARAKALDAVDALPDEWNVSKMILAGIELAKIDMPAARGFAEILAENEAQEECWQAEAAMWPLFDALRQSLSSIAADPSVADTDKIGRVADSVNQFVEALKAEWPDVADAVDKIAKASPNADRMAPFIKAGLAGAKEAIMPEVKTQADIAKAMNEDAIFKSLVDELIKNAVDAAVAKAKKDAEDAKDGGADEMMEDASGKPTKKGLEFIAKHQTGDAEEILKVGDRTIRKSIVGADTFEMFKAQQADITKERDARVDAEMTKRATEEYPSLVGTAVEKGAILKHLASAPEDVRKSAEAILTAAEKATKAAFTTAGAGDGQVRAPADMAKAKQDFMGKVDEIKARDKCSKSDAMSKAQREFPELHKAWQGETETVDA